jgi:putative ABC transport system permease protein
VNDGVAPPIPVTIVGVSPDIRQDRLDASPVAYLPFRAEAPAGITLIVRGTGGPARLAAAARNVANGIDPDLALGSMRTLDELRERTSWLSKSLASQFAEIGAVALVFSGLGLYSAMVYALKRRTQEIAIRMTLGAPARHVRWLFLRTCAWVVAGGLVLGVPASLAGSRLMQNNIVNSGPTDFVMLSGLTLVLVAVALLACILPARRATRLQPTIALRIE